jgi:hypothetical protein
LLFATTTTLIFVPVVFSMVHARFKPAASQPHVTGEPHVI